MTEQGKIASGDGCTGGETLIIGKGKETKDVVTPFAFSVDEKLIGVPLASPFRRALALFIDFFFVALLTNVSGLFLAGVLSILFYRGGRRSEHQNRPRLLRALLKLLAALTFILFLAGLFEELSGVNYADYFADTDEVTAKNESANDTADTVQKDAAGALEILALTAKYVTEASQLSDDIGNGQCEPALSCWQTLGNELATDLADIGFNKQQTDDLFQALLEQASGSLKEQEQQELLEGMQETFRLRTLESPASVTEQTDADVADTDPLAKLPANVQDAIALSEGNSEEEKLGIVDLAEALASDLGISIGWAAFYFTALTVWFNGGTPGKRMLGIKVVKLDGTNMSMWESFGRYSGYVAGFATGFMGFLQVFWDANRQAVQDKISETLVIDTRKKPVTVEIIKDGQPS